eukprot:GFYU01024135.1.p1 GENE.GFYU01024135.1~~GFYU01024135.1.p1  ORF type:complete len:562 (+),score=120.16 GFYU01024135.1:79-1686(+)
MSDEYYLGFDSSTQSVKATVISTPKLNVVVEKTVNFDKDLPHYGTQDGVHRAADGLTITSPPLMWLEALDLVLQQLKDAGVDLSKVKTVSGSGQQHGSVYWKKGASDTLKSSSGATSLKDHFAQSFAIAEAPVWMDASTTEQCKTLEGVVGGADAMAKLTGSKAYERFTSNQILKMIQTRPAEFAECERISLVSSFVPSVLCGQYAPIDAADGSGMNLMDISTIKWVPEIIAHLSTAAGRDVQPLLGDPQESHTMCGTLSEYFVLKYGFTSSCEVATWSGDNPCSLAGLRLDKPGDVAVSLGTSNTVFASLTDPQPSQYEGHVFCNPICPGSHMALVCYKNGTLATQDICQQHCGGSWDKFSEILSSTQPGNGGNIGFYYRDTEITPFIGKPTTRRFDSNGTPQESFDASTDVRAVVEAQMMSMRLHGANVGIKPARVLATGGASNNKAILQVMADVFQCPVYTASTSSSASLGAAYRAYHAHRAAEKSFVPFATAMEVAEDPFVLMASPSADAASAYNIDRFETLEKKVAAEAV